MSPVERRARAWAREQDLGYDIGYTWQLLRDMAQGGVLHARAPATWQWRVARLWTLHRVEVPGGATLHEPRLLPSPLDVDVDVEGWGRMDATTQAVVGAMLSAGVIDAE